MQKRKAELGVQYASMKVGLSEVEVLFKDRSFFQFDNQGAIFIPDTYTIVFNTDWLDSMHDEEILRCAFHETRHAYQKACLEFPELMVVDVSDETLEKWRLEFANYTNDENNGYDYQEIEKDANEFADKLLEELAKKDKKK